MTFTGQINGFVRQERCPECGHLTQVRASGLFVAHRSDREKRSRCEYSLGISSLPDLRAKPQTSRVDVIRARAKART
jgi:ribosomal protein S27AE